MTDFQGPEDKSVDFICAPNHWHAPATILGCSAGKHVYVEALQPQSAGRGVGGGGCSQDKRVVQMGSQRQAIRPFGKGSKNCMAAKLAA